jgi:hypothetical protein
MQIGAGVVWIYQQALLIIRGYLCKLRFCFVNAVFALQGSRFVIQYLCQ